MKNLRQLLTLNLNLSIIINVMKQVMTSHSVKHIRIIFILDQFLSTYREISNFCFYYTEDANNWVIKHYITKKLFEI